MLEKMSDFFEARLEGYDAHMLGEIESATEFYPFTASLLPTVKNSRVLDLGCGTGLELEEYYKLCPTASVTGIDLSERMLARLREKLPNKDIKLLVGSYFDLPFGESLYDAAVSVESLHHFTKSQKLPLYQRLCGALVEKGYFILTDYFASTDAEEALYRQTLIDLKAEQGICDDDFYHYDTPLTVAHESEALMEAGFSSVEILRQWGATYTLKANKA